MSAREFAVADLVGLGARLLSSAGAPDAAAEWTARLLVDADQAGLASHGLMLLPMYLDRLAAGSVSPTAEGRVLRQDRGSILFDAENGLGQVTSRKAVDLARDACRAHGFAAVAVRNGFHFGAAGTWAETIARDGMIGMAFSNTRPLMPAPGGAEAQVGNNPLAIAVPCAGEEPLVLDMALSAVAMGRIRNAASAGAAIPEGWATDRDGRPTTDPSEAIAGMLLPAGGPKGFGLAMMIELLTGGLSGGGIGAAVRPLYGDASLPYNCSHFFLAIAVEPLAGAEAFARTASALAGVIRGSRLAPGCDRVLAPGDPARIAREAHRQSCPLSAATVQALLNASSARGVDTGNIHP